VSRRRAGKATRDVILDAALALLTRTGANIRLEDVAREAGVTRQSVYIHFGSRSGLLLALVQHVDADGTLDDLVQQVLDARGGAAALDAVVRLHAEYSPRLYPLARVFMAGLHGDDALRGAWEDRMEARRSLYRFVVESLEGEGLLAAGWDVEVAIDLIFALTSWQVFELLVVDRGWSGESYYRHVRTALRRTLLQRAG
jgi:AcrR family transcriptional regulator